MNSKFIEIRNKARKLGPKKIAVAVAQDEDVMLAVEAARIQGMAEAILVGDQELIDEIAEKNHIEIDAYEIIDEKDPIEACRIVVKLVSSQQADIVMKGIIDTSVILKAVLDKKIGLRTDRILSHISVFESEKFERLFFLTDGGMNILPDLDAKKQIVENAVQLAHDLGIEEPKVAIVCAKEKVNAKMPATLDAQALEEMNAEGVITGCVIGGPLALDNAVSEAAAQHKNIDHPVAGKADILVMPNIEAGNIFYKSLVFFSDAEKSGLVLGAKAPIIVTSRADSKQTKLNSIALAILMTKKF